MADDDGESERSTKKANQYSSRMNRARRANSERRGILSGAVALSSATAHVEADGIGAPLRVESVGREIAVDTASASATATPAAPAVAATPGNVQVLVKADTEGSGIVFWQWNAEQKLMAAVRTGRRGWSPT